MTLGTTGRTIGWAVAVAVPVAALVTFGLDAFANRRRDRDESPYRSIHDVPARPPLWRERPRRPPSPAYGVRHVAAVPPENPHSPPTPPNGVPRL